MSKTKPLGRPVSPGTTEHLARFKSALPRRGSTIENAEMARFLGLDTLKTRVLGRMMADRGLVVISTNDNRRVVYGKA